MALKLCFNCLNQVTLPKHAIVTEHVLVAYIIIHHFALRLLQVILVIAKVRIRVQTATQIQQLSVKENRINPLTALVVVLIVVLTQHHKHNHTPINPLLHQTKAIQVNRVAVSIQVINLPQSIPLM